MNKRIKIQAEEEPVISSYTEKLIKLHQKRKR